MLERKVPRVSLDEMIESDTIITNEGRDLGGMTVIDEMTFQMFRGNPDRICDFDVWLTTGEDLIKDSNLAVCAATPSEGQFVIYEIRGMKIDWEKIDGCLLKTYEKKMVVANTSLKFYGLKTMPRRCVSVRDQHLSRAFVVWHTEPVIDEVTIVDEISLADKIVHDRFAPVVERQEKKIKVVTFNNILSRFKRG